MTPPTPTPWWAPAALETALVPLARSVVGLPVVAASVEHADVVRLVMDTLALDELLVEFPESLTDQLLQAVGRLPEVSVIVYTDDEGLPAYHPIEPACPLVEATRLAVERGIRVRCVDPDLGTGREHHPPLPDTYTMARLGPARYTELLREGGVGTGATEVDLRRRRGMAFHVRAAAERGDRCLFVGMIHHMDGVRAAAQEAQARSLGRVSRKDAALFNVHPDSTREILQVPPWVTALYELRRHEGWRGEERRTPAVVARGRFSVLMGGGAKSDEELIEEALARSAPLVDAAMASPDEVGAPDQPAPEAEEGIRPPLDRGKAMLRLLKEAEDPYERRTRESIQPWHRQLMAKFSRNYALVERRIVPDLFQLVATARASVDDNFAYEVWLMGTTLPWQRETADLPTIRISGDDLWLGARRMYIRRRLPKRKDRLVRMPFSKRKREQFPGQWLGTFEPNGFCSYPPEDIIIEDFGAYLRKKGVAVISSEQSRVEPFSTSMLDGLDMRETIRQKRTDGRIWVRHHQKVEGQADSVVMIFDEDPASERYPMEMTWLGEHDQESDMAFYSTPLGGHMVGPGIARCEYGGFLLVRPRGRLYDPWHDDDYSLARRRHEVLLLAGIDYAHERHVVYVAARPPARWIASLASRLGKKIVYLPLGQLSPDTIRKLRVFHILSGHDVRTVAKDYIW